MPRNSSTAARSVSNGNVVEAWVWSASPMPWTTKTTCDTGRGSGCSPRGMAQEGSPRNT